jgi:hypothetical protein
MIRNFLLIFLSVLCFSAAQAQEYSFGVKGGANYATTAGTVTGSSSNQGFFDGTVEAESKIGFHAGVFFELRFGKFFVRPEVMYNTIETEFSFPSQPSIYKVEKLSIPFLFGYNVWGPIDVYAGPVYQNILSATLEGTEPVNRTIVVQNTPLAAQIGAKASLGRFELGIRYDRSMASEESDTSLDFNNGQYGINRSRVNDLRHHQVLVSLSFKIGDSKSNTGRRRGGGCYF